LCGAAPRESQTLSQIKDPGPLTQTTDRPSNTALPPASQALSDVADLARDVMTRLCDAKKPGTVSKAASDVLGNPVAAALAYALCDVDDESANVVVQDLLDAGLSVDEICLEYLGPAARHLGALWDRDRLPFTEVAVATARIQSLIRRMPARGAARLAPISELGATFVAVPGEEHTLGVIMAADLFRRNGWDIALLVAMPHEDLIARLIADDRRVIGLSCSGDHTFPALRRLMEAIRRNRPEAKVLLSGQVVRNPDRLSTLPQPFTCIFGADEIDPTMQRLAADLKAEAADRRRPARA